MAQAKTTQTTMRKEITDLASNLAAAGIPMEAIANEFLITGAGIFVQARGAEFTAARLEDAAKKLRTGEAAAETRRQ